MGFTCQEISRTVRGKYFPDLMNFEHTETFLNWRFPTAGGKLFFISVILTVVKFSSSSGMDVTIVASRSTPSKGDDKRAVLE